MTDPIAERVQRLLRFDEPTGTFTISPNDTIKQGELMAYVVGIATSHRLYRLEGGSEDGTDTLVYIVFPESGPMSALRRWMAEPRARQTWKVTSDREGYMDTVAATRWVAEQAFGEVMAEWTD